MYGSNRARISAKRISAKRRQDPRQRVAGGASAETYARRGGENCAREGFAGARGRQRQIDNRFFMAHEWPEEASPSAAVGFEFQNSTGQGAVCKRSPPLLKQLGVSNPGRTEADSARWQVKFTEKGTRER